MQACAARCPAHPLPLALCTHSQFVGTPVPCAHPPHYPTWHALAAPKYESLGARLADVANTALGTMGLSQGVTDNASVNVVPLQVRWAAKGGGAMGISVFGPAALGRPAQSPQRGWHGAKAPGRGREGAAMPAAAPALPPGCRTAAPWQ